MVEPTREGWMAPANAGSADMIRTPVPRPTWGTLFQRIGYGALSLLIVFLVFLCDVSLSRYCEPGGLLLANDSPSRFLRHASATGWGQSLTALLRRGSLVPLLTLTLMLVAAAEFVKLARQRGAKPHDAFAYLMVALLIVSPWLSSAGWLGERPAQVEGLYWSFMLTVASAVGLAFLTVLRGNPKDTFRDVGSTLAVILYVGLLGSFATQLRCSRDIPVQEGAWLLLIVVFVAKCTDIGGYLVGSAIGRHKLAPSISPGKSWEGLLGGFACSALASGIVAWSGLSRSFRMAEGGESGFTAYWHPVVFGLLLSLIAQVGDLFESCFKRDAGSKDSGRFFPRFGGILDLLDSLLPTLPVGWFLLTAVWGIG